VLVDGSPLSGEDFLTTAAVTSRSHATRNFADPVFELQKHPELHSLFPALCVSRTFHVQQSVPRFNPIVAITSASAVWSNSFVTRCDCTTIMELDGFKGLGDKRLYGAEIPVNNMI
jgi:hypothetical protein